MKVDQYVVPGVSCGHCVRAVTAEVSKLTGVKDVKVNLDNKVVTVESGDDVASEAIIAAIKEAGYEEVAPIAV